MAVQVEERASIFDRPLTSLITVDWEKVILVALLLLAIGSRFIDLGARSYNHDESIHTLWSHDLYVGKGYIHNPIYHGPLLYHLTAASFFLFGDTDVTGRLPNVVFGIVLVLLPFFFRKWLGRRGWIVTSVVLLISPAITYYSRFNRHDIYVEVFVVLMLLCIMRFLDARSQARGDGSEVRSDRWLYGTAAVLALSFTAMETTFIFTALFGYFLTTLFTYELLHSRKPDGKPLSHLTIAALLGLPIFGLYLLYSTVKAIGSKFGITTSAEPIGDRIPAFDLSVVLGTLCLPLVLPPLVIQYVFHRDPLDYSSVSGIYSSAAVLIAAVILSAVIGLAWNARKWIICALLFYPIMLFFFTTVFTNPAGIGSGFIGSLGYWLTQQGVHRGDQPPYYYLMVTLPMYEYLPYLFGVIGIGYFLYTRGKTRLLLFLAWLIPLLAIAFFVWFTPGVLPAVQSLLGSKDTLSAGNTVTLVLIPLIPLFLILSLQDSVADAIFPSIVGIWTLGVLILFSWAGEKMPWLLVHLATPLAFTTGYFMERVLPNDTRELGVLIRNGAILFGLVLALGLLTLAFQILFGPAPLQGTPLDQQARLASTIVSTLIVAICAGVLFYLGQRFGLSNALRVTVLTLFAILALFTIHTTALAAYINSDVAVETLIYAQGTPDEPVVMQEINTLSRRLCAQATPDSKTKINCDNGTIKVAYDDDSSWPFTWYFRNFRNAQFYGKSPGAPFDAEVVIVGPDNEAGVKPFLGNRYVRRQMRLIWWPDEYYKDLSWPKMFGGTDPNGQPVQGLLTGENLKSLVRDIWFFHKYTHSLSAWPYVKTFALYIRRDITDSLWQYGSVVAPAQQTTQEDLYTTKYIQLQAQTAIGSPGTGNGQFTLPHNVAIDAQGEIYVADTNNSRIEKFDSSGNFMSAWGSKGNLPGQFNEPWGIAVNKQGEVYVADTWNHRIEKFDSSGTFIDQWGTFNDGHQEQLGPDQFYGPRAVAIDGQGNVWVTDTGNKRVLEFDPQGKPLGQFGSTGSDPGQFLEPVGIAIDPSGNIYVADTWNQRIQKFDKDFKPLQQWPVEAWDSQTVVNKPYLAVDANGNVYASDPEGYRVMKFGTDGKLRAVWGVHGTDLASMDQPTGLALGPDGRIFVADAANNRILVFAPVMK